MPCQPAFYLVHRQYTAEAKGTPYQGRAFILLLWTCTFAFSAVYGLKHVLFNGKKQEGTLAHTILSMCMTKWGDSYRRHIMVNANAHLFRN